MGTYVLAAITVLLGIRLAQVMGRKSSVSRTRRPNPIVPVVKKKAAKKVATRAVALEKTTAAAPLPEENSALGQALAALRAKDPTFAPAEFLAGVRRAFTAITRAFASGDLKTLRALTSEDVFAQFGQAIEERRARRQTLEITLARVRTPELTAVRVENTMAHITVQITSEQIDVTKDEENRIIDGDPHTAHVITESWTFARDFGNTKNADWTLVATES